PKGAPPLPPAKEGLGRREILLAEHIISNAVWLHEKKFDEQFQQILPEAMAELEKLSTHRQWWARLYAVQIMRQNHFLLKNSVLRRLADDEHPLVRKAAARSDDQPGSDEEAEPLVAPRNVNVRSVGPTS